SFSTFKRRRTYDAVNSTLFGHSLLHTESPRELHGSFLPFVDPSRGASTASADRSPTEAERTPSAEQTDQGRVRPRSVSFRPSPGRFGYVTCISEEAHTREGCPATSTGSRCSLCIRWYGVYGNVSSERARRSLSRISST